MDRDVLNGSAADRPGTAATLPSTDRRKFQRRTPVATESLSRVRLRLGSELAVLNVSDSGILVDGPCRLSPGGRIDVHVITVTGRVLRRATVMRAHVSALAADALRYRGALTFDEMVDTGSVAG